MPKPSIAYVDEQSDERDNFFGDAFDSDLFHEIHLISPNPDLNVTLAELLDLKIDALVTDFDFSDAGQINYSGEELVTEFLSKRKSFPCFIRTSFEADALRTSADVNRIYSKNPREDERAGRALFNRIALQIEHYQRQIAMWHSELEDLMSIPPDARKESDIEKIVELDRNIESAMGNDLALSNNLKMSLFDVRGDLLEEAERLVFEIKRTLDERSAEEDKPARDES